ncbi:MAG: glycoside hydrolase family 3 C-terminal domain-containing protein [Clostridium sp.]|uniref:beta-glucosidase n=1 Tax=Clostridium sp. TaxID=1506 RepID=UPI001EC84FD7|nr:glycoside hydrolase family 3 C-terminal domain-containing protein [Clostridium sp.]MBS5884470.1 glycoside hydrolase family 3 C-terminal domain-containing protein [Clostridium sp.]MDU7147787.1 glycoside hydrolase family 3 C-terminal domain-containing protein [Clostridium sp.]
MKVNENKIEEILGSLTLEEKVGMIHGAGLFRTEGVERLGIKPLKMSDGPMGVRNEFPDNSWVPYGHSDDYVSYLPSNTALASTWNRELAYKEGYVLGNEARGRGKDIILAPGINIIRSPLCGRNFEYMSEDPYLTKEMAVPYIKGVQENDVAACVKHFAVNNQETERLNVDVVVSDRALREIYFPAFEAAVKEGNTYSMMSAYNKIWNHYCAHNPKLLQEILKDEWGFDGVLVSDWSGIHDTKEAAEAGMDIEMSVTYNFDEYFFANPMIKAVKEGLVKEEVIDDKIRNILKLMYKLNMFSEDRKKGAYNSYENRQKTLEIARESVILLKNEENVLPLKEKEIKTVAIIGENADIRHSLGGGSAEIKALYEVTPLLGLKMKLGGNTEVKYAKGYTFKEDEREKLLNEAIELAKNSDAVIFVGGLKHTKENFELYQNALQSNKEEDVVNIDSEGNDKTNMSLPYNQYEVIEELLKVNKDTVVVITTGSPVDMSSFKDEAKAIVQTSYNGMEGGLALAEVLFGDVNPSGKLAVTIPRKLEDSPAHCLGEFPGSDKVRYDEDIFVGYRYFSSYDVEPLFAFGHGLSYTSFAYDNLSVSVNEVAKNISDVEGDLDKELGNDLEVKVTLDVTNTGDVAGAEVVQLYVNDVEATEKRPNIELKGFEKIHLESKETKEVTITLDKKAFAFYKEAINSWIVEEGDFNIILGSSSADLRVKETINIKNQYKF